MLNDDRRKKIQWCIFAVGMAVSLLIASLTISYYYGVEVEEFHDRADASSLSEIMLHEIIFQRELKGIANDVRFLAENPVMQRYLDDPSAENLEFIDSFWKRMIGERDIYDQIRLLDTNGMETIRIEYNERSPVSIPVAELQDKSGRYYFEESLALRRGRIFVSEFDLNHENGLPETPFKPTIRFGVGVYNSKNERMAIMVVNYNAQSYLELLHQSSADEQADFMLVNHEGYWLMHPDKEKEWGQFTPGNKDINFAMFYPDAWEIIRTEKKGKFTIGDQVYDFDTFDLQSQQSFVSTRPLAKAKEKSDYLHSTLIKHIALLPSHVIADYRSKVFNQCMVIGLIWFLVSVFPCWGGASYLIGHFSEQAQLSRQAHYDTVTGLSNRVSFNERFDHALQMAERHKRICALLYVDLDGFKPINDQMGHHIGDELLAGVATIMLKCVRKTDTVARIGGDEFAIILTEIDNKADATEIADKLVSHLANPIVTSKGAVDIGASIGVVVYPEDGLEANKLLELADNYMYTNKRAHKQNVKLTKDALHTSSA